MTDTVPTKTRKPRRTPFPSAFAAMAVASLMTTTLSASAGVAPAVDNHFTYDASPDSQGGTWAAGGGCDALLTVCGAVAAGAVSACVKLKGGIDIVNGGDQTDFEVQACASVGASAAGLGTLSFGGAGGLVSAVAYDKDLNRVSTYEWCPNTDTLYTRVCSKGASVSTSEKACVSAEANSWGHSLQTIPSFVASAKSAECARGALAEAGIDVGDLQRSRGDVVPLSELPGDARLALVAALKESALASFDARAAAWPGNALMDAVKGGMRADLARSLDLADGNAVVYGSGGSA